MSLYKFGSLILDVERRVITRDGEPLQLGPKVVETLLALIERSGQLVTKAELLDRVWPDSSVQEGTLAQHICIARKALRKHGVDAIQTVARRGYRFTGEVAAINRASTEVQRRSFWSKRVVGLAAAAMVLIAVMAGSLRGAAGSHVRPLQLSATGARYYALGKYYWNQRTKAGMRKGARYFTMVVVSDPANALGYAGLAETYALDAEYGFGPMPMSQSYKMAQVYARRAVSLDARSAEAHAALGLSEESPHTRLLALTEYRRAVTLDPSNAAAHEWYGGCLLEIGKVPQALSELRRASQLDPSSVATLSWLAQAAFFARSYDEAIRSAHEALDLSPSRADAYMGMGLGYEMRHNYRQAEIAYKTYARMCPMCRSDAAALLAHLYATAGRRDDARRELAIARHDAVTMDHESVAGDLAAALVALGMRPQALTLVVKARHDSILLGADPRLDPVRKDPQFRPYLRPVALT